MYGFRYGYAGRQRGVRRWGPIDYLFAAGEQGLWLDPSDLSTLFQDTAGTIPVTAPGQTVALGRDKSGRGNHLIQPVALSRPTLGRHPVGGRRNLLTYTEDFSNAPWLKSSSPLVTLTNQGGGVWRLQAPAGNWGLRQERPVTGTHTFAIDVKSSGAGLDGFTLMLSGSTFLGDRTATDQWARYSFSGSNIGSGAVGIIRNSSQTAVDILIRLPQFEAGTIDTPYQRVTSDWDVVEAGKRDCWYLGFDGVDDFMVTAATLDLSATDKVTLFAGVQKFTDAATGIVAEFSGNVSLNAGTFYLVNGDGSSNSRPWSTSSRGTVAATSS
ncbi:hypothetical protein EJV44_04720, partial [Ancylobacter aquaticus]